MSSEFRVSTISRRLGYGLIVFGTFSVCRAQVDVSFGQAGVKALSDNNVLNAPRVSQFQPSPGPGLPDKDKVDPTQLGQSSGVRLLHGNLHYLGSNVYITDDVILLARGYRITCDRAYGSLDTKAFTLQGNVHIDSEQFVIRRAGSVTIDLVHGTFNAFDSDAQLSPEAVENQLQDDLYVKSHQAYGTQYRSYALDGSTTTCNKPDPHYEIDAVSTDIKPHRRIIFRKAKLKILGYTVLRIPYLVVPLEDRTYKNLPVVGDSPDEGYFVKWQYGIPLKNPDYYLTTKEDFMSKLGIGLGAQFAYRAPKDAGTVSLYHIFGSSDELDFGDSTRHAFPWGNLSVDIDYEKDNHLTNPDATNFNGKFSLLIPQGASSDKIDFTENSTNSFGYTTSSQQIALQDQRQFGTRTQTTFDLTYFGTDSQFSGPSSGTIGGNQETQRLDVNVQGQEDYKQAQAAIQYQRSIPIGQTQASYGSSDITPAISLTSDASRLFGPNVARTWPFTTQVSWGQYSDPENSSGISRAFFDFALNKIDTSQHRLRDDVTGEFKQGVYSDNTAEYVLAFNDNLRYDLGPDTGINLRYNYLRPYGYSPLSIDQTGETNYINADLNFRPVKPLLIGADTAYDLVRLQQHAEPWQELQLRSEYSPTKIFLLRGLFDYDPVNTVWQSVRLDLTYVPGTTKLSLGGTFDGPTHTWSSASIFLQNLKVGKTTFSTAMTYDGYLKKFDSQQFNFIYDLHCVDAILQIEDTNYGYRAGRTVSFYIRVKALPYDLPFGTGTRGQPIGIQSGSSF